MHRRTPAALALFLSPACRVEEPGAFPSHRLTPTEYNYTVRDLMGYAPGSEDRIGGDEDWDEEEEEGGIAAWPWIFPAEVEIHGFEGHEDGQIASPYLIEQYQAAAVHFSTLMMDAPAFWTCSPDQVDGDRLRTCARDSVVKLGHRAYRRPMTEGEQQRLVRFFEQSADQHGVRDGARLAVQGLLMSPQFLYRLEPKPSDGKKPDKLDDFALANRLSYFLWDSMPDPQLFEAAANGKLRKRKHVEAEVARMLDDPRARQAVVRFHEQWLDIDAVYSVTADLDKYMPVYLPGVGDDIDPEESALFQEEVEEMWSSWLIGARTGMVKEAQLFVEKTVFEGGGDLNALLTDNHGYVTYMDNDVMGGGTADIYGVTEDDLFSGPIYEQSLDDGNLGFELRHVPAEFPADQRSGVLTLGAVLAGRAHPVHPAPVLRGVFVLERLACVHLGQPPDSAAGQAPADTLDAEATNRARLEAVTTAPECIACHQQINPVGFAFENYDSLGGWRTEDNGQAVDASGQLVLGGEQLGRFTNASELGGLLAKSDAVHDCYSLNWMRYALGREVDPNDPHLKAVQQRFRETNGDVLDLVTEIAVSDQFRYH